jgi:hypothetical protein
VTWFAFKDPHYPPIDVAGIQEKNLVIWGFHGYATKTQALANPNDVSPLQKPILDGAELDYQKSHGSFVPSLGDLPGISNVNDFLSRLVGGNIWLRIAEVMAGMILLWVGLNALTRGTAAGTAVQTVKGGAKKLAAVA